MFSKKAKGQNRGRIPAQLGLRRNSRLCDAAQQPALTHLFLTSRTQRARRCAPLARLCCLVTYPFSTSETRPCLRAEPRTGRSFRLRRNTAGFKRALKDFFTGPTPLCCCPANPMGSSILPQTAAVRQYSGTRTNFPQNSMTIGGEQLWKVQSLQIVWQTERYARI